jgi:hypothetical protein
MDENRNQINLNTKLNQEKDKIERAIALARVEKPAYAHLYSFLEAIFIAGVEAKEKIGLEIPDIAGSLARTKWENGFPLLNRWDFPIEPQVAEHLLREAGRAIPDDNRKLADAYNVLNESLALHSGQKIGRAHV